MQAYHLQEKNRQHAPVVPPGYEGAQQGHALLTAAFAAFVLVLLGHRGVFARDESHESSFPLVSIRSLSKRLQRSLVLRSLNVMITKIWRK